MAFAVNLEGREFVGRAALGRREAGPTGRCGSGLELAGRRVPREHYAVLASGEPMGEVTSGTFSPTLQKPIAMAYVPPQFATVGTELAVDIRGSNEPARVVKLTLLFSTELS